MMDLTEELIRAAAQEVTGGLQVTYQGEALDFGPPFRRASMHTLVAEVTGGRPFPAASVAGWCRMPCVGPCCFCRRCGCPCPSYD